MHKSNTFAYFVAQGGLKNVYDKITLFQYWFRILWCTFFYVISGCDTVSSFFIVGKYKFYDALSTFKNINKLKEVFKALGNEADVISQIEFDMLEQFSLHVYYPKQYISNEGLSEVRMSEFESNPNVTMRHLPPSKIGLMWNGHVINQVGYGRYVTRT